MKIKLEGLDEADRLDLAKAAVAQARRLLRNNSNVETVLNELDNARSYLIGLNDVNSEVQLVRSLLLYTFALIQLNNIPVNPELTIPSIDQIKQEIDNTLSDDEKQQNATNTMENFRELVRKPNEEINSRLLLRTIHQSLDLAELEAPYQRMMAGIQNNLSLEELILNLGLVRTFILNSIKNADNSKSRFVQVAHGREKIQAMIVQQFNLAEKCINDTNTPLATCISLYRENVALYGEAFSLLTEESVDVTVAFRNSFNQLTKSLSIRVNTTTSKQLDEMPDDLELLTHFGKQLEEYQKVLPNQKNGEYNPYAELMQVRIKYLHRIVDVAIKQLSSNSVVPSLEVFKGYEAGFQIVLNNVEQLITLSDQYSTEGLKWLALAKKATFQNLVAQVASSSLTGNPLFVFFRQEKDVALSVVKAFFGEKWSESIKSSNDISKVGHVLPSLYTMSMRYYDMTASLDSDSNPTYCAIKAHEIASLVLELAAKYPKLASSYEVLISHTNTIKLELDNSPAVKESQCLTRYELARKNKDYQVVIQAGNELLAIFQERLNDEAESKRISTIQYEIALSYLSLDSLDVPSRNNEAIKVLRKAVNNGTVVNRPACLKLKELLESELALPTCSTKTFIKREIAVIEAKIASSLRVSIPAEASSSALNTPVNGALSITQVRSAQGALASLVPTYVNLPELFERMAANDNSPVKPLYFFKSNFGAEPLCRAKLMEYILSKNDNELKQFNAETLYDVGLGLFEGFYSVPAGYSRNWVLERFFSFAALDPSLKAVASFQLARLYSTDKKRHSDAVTCYETAAGGIDAYLVTALKAHLALSDIHINGRNFDKAIEHLDLILHRQCPKQEDKAAFDRVQAQANFSRRKVEQLMSIKRSIPHTPQETMCPSSEKERKRPMVVFDIDNTIFRTSGVDDRFLCDLNNELRAASKNLTDFKKFYIGGIDGWREIFTAITALGVDIGIVTAKPHSGREHCPLFRDLVTSFADLFGNNPNIIFTDGADKYPSLLHLCRGNKSNILKRKYCLLVDDLEHNTLQAEAAKFPFVNVKGLAESNEESDFIKFKTDLLIKVADMVAEFNQQNDNSNSNSADNSDLEEGEVAPVAFQGTAACSSTAQTISTSPFAVPTSPTLFGGRSGINNKRKDIDALTGSAAEAFTSDSSAAIHASKKAAKAPDRLEHLLPKMGSQFSAAPK